MLRYFNPVGAHPSGRLGEGPRGGPSNLLPYVTQVAAGLRERLMILGDDYDTPDGTGVRDFIHVEDLAAGHISALRYLRETGNPLTTFNLGTGRGTSMKELVAAFERASGREIPVEVAAWRPGDVGSSYADPSLAERVLGWKAERTTDDTCRDAWRWRVSNPRGYEGDIDGARASRGRVS